MPKFLSFLAGFGLGRAFLFFSPIAIANLLPLESYGRLELAQSYAAIGTLLLGCGLSATVPLIRLRDEIDGRWDTLLFLIAGLAGMCLLLAGLATWLFPSYSVPVLVSLAITVLMMQGLWANFLKSNGQSTSAVFVEAGFWIAALVGAGLVALSGGSLAENVISLALLCYAAGLMVVTVTQYIRHTAGAFKISDLRRNFALGLPLMFTGILTAVLIAAGRLVLGQTSGIEAVGLYAVLYRSTTLPMVGHQILIIGFFRHIFHWPDEVLRAKAPVIVLGVSAMALAFWALEPSLGWLLGHKFVEVFSTYRTEGLVLLVQTILWSAIALNDLINSRLQIAGRVTKLTAPFLAVGLGALGLWTWAQAPSLELGELLNDFIFGHLCLMAGFYAVQCIASWWLGQRFTGLWLTVIACTIGTGSLIFIGERFF